MSDLGTRFQYRRGLKHLSAALEPLRSGRVGSLEPVRGGLEGWAAAHGVDGVGQPEQYHRRPGSLLRGVGQDGDTSLILYAPSGGSIDISSLTADEQAAFLANPPSDSFVSSMPDTGAVGADTPLTIDLPNGTSDRVIGTTPDGMVLTAAGWQSIPQPDGSERWVNVHTAQIMLSDGSIVSPSTPTPDGATVGATLQDWLKTGGAIASGVVGILQKLGITKTQPGTWLSGGQYRTGSGTVVTPVRLANGLYQLPDGTIVGAPPSSGLGELFAIGGLAAVGWLLFKRLRGHRTAAA
jgi:hypothetical protein